MSVFNQSNFEYLDHTADVMFHSWGKNINEAFEHLALAMYNYMVELDSVSLEDESEVQEVPIEVSGHDMDSLLFSYLDEFLFQFSTEFVVCKEIKVTSFDKENWKISAVGKGVLLDKSKHTTGTEIKAITYSCMKVEENAERTDVHVIVDI